MENPYQPPGFDPWTDVAKAPAVDRTPFLLAAVGAGLASAYWAGLTLLIGVSAAARGTSGFQVVLPLVLIVLYAMRGMQVWKGDPSAARRLLWLHGVGGIYAIVQMAAGGPILMALNVIKAAIHVFGGVSAYLAQGAASRQRAR
jgi:hypothetical protein